MLSYLILNLLSTTPTRAPLRARWRSAAFFPAEQDGSTHPASELPHRARSHVRQKPWPLPAVQALRALPLQDALVEVGVARALALRLPALARPRSLAQLAKRSPPRDTPPGMPHIPCTFADPPRHSLPFRCPRGGSRRSGMPLHKRRIRCTFTCLQLPSLIPILYPPESFLHLSELLSQRLGCVSEGSGFLVLRNRGSSG